MMNLAHGRSGAVRPGRIESPGWIVSYNGSFGYPERAFADPSLGQADEELGWRITGFEVP